MKIKKALSVLLMLAMVLSLMSGCSSDKKEDTNGGQAPEEKDIIVMYTNAEYPPYEYFDGDKIVGADVEVAKIIAEKLGKELKIEHVEFDSIVPAIEAGRGDFGAAGMAITPERLESIDFSVPYVVAGQSVIYKEESGLDTLEKLAGKKIGVQLGTTSDDQMNEAVNEGVLKGTKTEVKQYSNPLDATQDMLAGRIDAVVLNTATGEEIVKQNKGLNNAEIELFTEKMAICVKKGNTELLDKINVVLEELMAEGKIEEFLEAHTQE